MCLPVFSVGCMEYGVKSFFGSGGVPTATVLEDSSRQEDFWEASKTDLIFFGDTSGSMTAELETMGDHAYAFMDRLDDYDTSWQMVVATGPTGCGVNGIISTGVEDYADLYAEALVTPPDAAAAADGADEWGLYNVDQAVAASAPGGCNEGFLRDDALLHIIMLSDENDESPGWDGADEDYWQTYIDSIQAAKGEGYVTLSAVVGPVPDGCEGADPGFGYASAVDASGGALLSICDAWYESLDILVLASVQVSDFPLSQTPDPDTIRVEVNDEERSSGWEYQATGNLVHFSEALPTISYTVSISYDIAD